MRASVTTAAPTKTPMPAGAATPAIDDALEAPQSSLRDSCVI
jgi:hypothetical protein